MFAGGVPGKGEAVDTVAEHGGEEREAGEEDEPDGEHHANGDGTEGGNGHDKDRGEADKDGESAKEDSFAGGIHGDADGTVHVVGGGVKGGTEAGDDEEGVVDAKGEGEHHREVERPDGEIGEPGDAEEDAHGGDETDRREDQGQTGSGECAEGDDEDDSSDRPGEKLGLHHAFTVYGVEVGPEGRGPGEGDGDGVG